MSVSRTRLVFGLFIFLSFSLNSHAVMNVCKGNPGDSSSVGISYAFSGQSNPFNDSTFAAINGTLLVKVATTTDPSQGVMVPDPLNNGALVPPCTSLPKDPSTCEGEINTYWANNYSVSKMDPWEKGPGGFCVCVTKFNASVLLSGAQFPANVNLKDSRLVNLFYSDPDPATAILPIFGQDVYNLGLFPDFSGYDSYRKIFDVDSDPLAFQTNPKIMGLSKDFAGLTVSKLSLNGTIAEGVLELKLLESSALSSQPHKNNITSFGYTAFVDHLAATQVPPDTSSLCLSLGPSTPLKFLFTEN